MRRLSCLAGLAMILGRQISTVNMLVAAKQMSCAINPSPVAAISFLVLAGNLMATAGISRGRVEFANSLVGDVQGGLLMTCVLTCMIFAAMSFSSVATRLVVGAILIAATIKHGNPRSRAAAPQAPGAELGLIIAPPAASSRPPGRQKWRWAKRWWLACWCTARSASATCAPS